ncbi:MAG TPA: hypothetical protein VLH35_05245, partial [Candidatus Acidoferrales bacterium]|nr:hypothetical protein [Candidatus Acidoferrales bacterium]
CATKDGTVALARSPNKQNSFWVQIEPEQEHGTFVDEGRGTPISFDEHRNVLVDYNRKTEQLTPEVLQAIIAGFEYACHAGPLCGEPMRQVMVNLIHLELSPDVVGDSEVMRGVGKAIFGSFLTANPTLLEPVYRIIITVASEHVGDCSRILQTKRGKVINFEQKGLLTQITGYIPVAETFGFSKELRSATSGRAVWQSLFDHWEKVPQKQALEVVTELRKRKGLAVDVPKPEKFME